MNDRIKTAFIIELIAQGTLDAYWSCLLLQRFTGDYFISSNPVVQYICAFFFVIAPFVLAIVALSKQKGANPSNTTEKTMLAFILSIVGLFAASIYFLVLLQSITGGHMFIPPEVVRYLTLFYAGTVMTPIVLGIVSLSLVKNVKEGPKGFKIATIIMSWITLGSFISYGIALVIGLMVLGYVFFGL